MLGVTAKTGSIKGGGAVPQYASGTLALLAGRTLRLRSGRAASAPTQTARKLICYFGATSTLENRRLNSVSFSHPTKAFARQDCIHSAQAEEAPIFIRRDDRMRTTPVAAKARTAGCC